MRNPQEIVLENNLTLVYRETNSNSQNIDINNIRNTLTHRENNYEVNDGVKTSENARKFLKKIF